MPQTVEGAKKMMNTIREKYGVDENGRSLQHVKAGRLGGYAKVAKGFAVSGKARGAGRLGGLKSKRGKAVK